LEWTGNALGGRSRAVAGDPYEVYVTEPAGWALAGFECDGGTSLKVERSQGWLKGGCAPSTSGTLAWRARFARK